MKKIVTLLLCALMLASLFTGCAPKQQGKPGPNESVSGKPDAGHPEPEKYQETITCLMEQEFKTFDTQNTTSAASASVYVMVFNTLIEVDTVENKLVPGLAESWEQVSDTVIELKLRKGVKFHNGVEFTADDVKFTLMRGKGEGAARNKLQFLDHVDIVDPYTVKLVLNAPNSDFIYMLSDFRLCILCKSAFDSMPAEEANRIGTGAFKYNEWVQGSYLKLTRFDDYWAGPVHTKEFIFREIPEPAGRLIALQNGEVDIILKPPYTDLHYIADDSKLQLIQFVGSNLRHLSLNTQVAPTDNLEIRKAIAYGVNREEYNDVSYNGCGTVVDNIMHPHNEFCAKINAIGYNPEKAKELLNSAGYKEGDITLEFLALNTEDDLNFATIFQAQMKEIGIKVNITQVDIAAFDATISPGNNTFFNVLLDGWGGYVNGPDNALRCIYYSNGSYNQANVNDPYVDSMLDEAIKVMDKEKRKQMYGELEQYINDKMYDVPICAEPIICAARASVEGIAPPNGSIYQFRNVYILIKP